MNKIPLFFLLLFFLFLEATHSLDVPPLKGYVNDYAGMISPGARSKLEAELKAFEHSDSTQIVILTIPSLMGEALEEYSMKVAETWKIGQKGKDNGILLLVANKEKKIRIEVGRGLEGRLTDLAAGRIIDLVIKPRFKRGDFDGGFTAGVHAMIDVTRGEYKGDVKDYRKKRTSLSSYLTTLFFAGVFLLFIGTISKLIGGFLGALGLPFIFYLLFAPSLFILLLLSGAGLLMGIFLPLLFSGGSGYSRGGGGWYGGFGGGGGSSDTFEGGGGDFGGGGASGEW